MTSSAVHSHTQGLWVTNSHPQPAVLCLEPWGDEISLPSGCSFLVMIEGPSGEFPAVEWNERRVTVYGWSGTVVSVHHEGKEIRSSGSVRVPEMPRPIP
jgi:hypothetical protein